MTTLAIEINDAGIIAVDASGILAESPGYALVERRGVVTGEAARRAGRQRPRHCHSRFWEELGSPTSGGRSGHVPAPANLVHAHLKSLWLPLADRAERVILAEPGAMDGRQLRLVLGIAADLGIPVQTVVDAAVIVARDMPFNRVAYIELQLSRAVIAVVHCAAGVWRRERVIVVPRAGVLPLQEHLLRGVAQAFVRSARYDPLSDAAAEQAVLDRLPEWLEMLRSRERAEIAIGAQTGPLGATLTRSEICQAIANVVARIETGLGDVARSKPLGCVLVGHRPGSAPGLKERLSETAGCEVRVLQRGAVALAALGLNVLPRESGAAVPYLTELPCGSSAKVPKVPATPSPVARRAGPSPSHLLYRGLAYPVGEQPLSVGRLDASVPDGPGIALRGDTIGVSRRHFRVYRGNAGVVLEDLSSFGTLVNGRRVEGEVVLQVGDRIRAGSAQQELQVIATVADDATQVG